MRISKENDPYGCSRDNHDNAQWVEDPFLAEVYDESVLVWLCDTHYEERSYEV